MPFGDLCTTTQSVTIITTNMFKNKYCIIWAQIKNLSHFILYLPEKNAQFSISYTIETLYILYNITYWYKTEFFDRII